MPNCNMNLHIDSEVKAQVESIFSRLDLCMDDVIALFFQRIIQDRSVLFSLLQEACPSQLAFQLNAADLIRALYWLNWVPEAKKRGVPQEYIDLQAIHRIDVFRTELSDGVRTLLENVTAQISDDSIEEGRAEELMSNACRYIIQQADTKDFSKYIESMETYPSNWKGIWENVRMHSAAPSGSWCNGRR